MSEEKKAKKPAKKPAKKAEADNEGRKGDVMICIGAAKKPAAEGGVAQVWALEGEERTASGDRYAVAFVSSKQLFELGWVRRKH